MKKPKIKVIDNEPDGILFAAKRAASPGEMDDWVRFDAGWEGETIQIDSSCQPGLGRKEVDQLIDWLTAVRKRMVL